MLTAHPNTVYQKRDLHVGGLGAGASGALASVTYPVRSAADSYLEQVKEAVRDADDYLHGNLWQSLAIAALVGLTAGYLLSRRAGR